MRGVIVVVLTIFMMGLALFVGVAAIEPVGDFVNNYDSINEGPLNGDSVIQDVYSSVFKWGPLITLAGIIVWAFRWYMRRERRVGRGP